MSPSRTTRPTRGRARLGRAGSGRPGRVSLGRSSVSGGSGTWPAGASRVTGWFVLTECGACLVVMPPTDIPVKASSLVGRAGSRSWLRSPAPRKCSCRVGELPAAPIATSPTGVVSVSCDPPMSTSRDYGPRTTALHFGVPRRPGVVPDRAALAEPRVRVPSPRSRSRSVSAEAAEARRFCETRPSRLSAVGTLCIQLFVVSGGGGGGGGG